MISADMTCCIGQPETPFFIKAKTLIRWEFMLNFCTARLPGRRAAGTATAIHTRGRPTTPGGRGRATYRRGDVGDARPAGGSSATSHGGEPAAREPRRPEGARRERLGRHLGARARASVGRHGARPSQTIQAMAHGRRNGRTGAGAGDLPAARQQQQQDLRDDTIRDPGTCVGRRRRQVGGRPEGGRIENQARTDATTNGDRRRQNTGAHLPPERMRDDIRDAFFWEDTRGTTVAARCARQHSRTIRQNNESTHYQNNTTPPSSMIGIDNRRGLFAVCQQGVCS